MNFFEKRDFSVQIQYTESVQTDKEFHRVQYRKLLLNLENTFARTKMLRWEGVLLRKGCYEGLIGAELQDGREVTDGSSEDLS